MREFSAGGAMARWLFTIGDLMKALLATVCCLAAIAAQAAPPSIDELKARVADVVERHVGTVACPGVKVAAGDVLALVPQPHPETLAKFAVLWHGDLGCWGGSGSERTHLTIATVNTGQVVVQPELSSPAIAFDSPVRFVERVVSSGPDTLVLEGKAYGPQDPRSNPTIPLRFTLRLDDKGNWKLVDKTVLSAR